ncbi:MAG: hypothetical protein AB7O45_01715 [Alphaproteobacteria bacterium]
MTGLAAIAGAPVTLVGTAYDRGRQQALRCPDMADDVRAAIGGRLAQVDAARGAAAGWLAEQRAWTERH